MAMTELIMCRVFLLSRQTRPDKRAVPRNRPGDSALTGKLAG